MSARRRGDAQRRYARLTREDWTLRPAATLARLPVRGYGYTLSSLVGRHCRHVPTCSEYMDEALGRHGLWAGGWMGFFRLCRCGPFGSSGLDPVPAALPKNARWDRPWRYRRPGDVLRCDVPDGARSAPAASPGEASGMDGPSQPV